MSPKRKILAAAAALAVIAGTGAVTAVTAGTSWASTPLVSASTSITNNPDSGGNGNWAYDDFTRTLTINTDAASSDCASLAGWSAAADVCYSATIADSGDADTIVNAFQPNQGINPDGDKITGPSEAVPFTGSSGYQFYAPSGDVPSAANVAATLDAGETVQAGADSTPDWYLQAFAASVRGAVTGTELNDWTWGYANSCESWTDSYANGAGQSTPLSTDGNITGEVCPAPPPSSSSPAPSAFSGGKGDVINEYGNGLDVYRQSDRVNTPVIAWPVTSTDPAVGFDFIAVGSGWAIEYAPRGTDSGLCVSEAVGSEPSWSPPTGLVERGCLWNKWQTFTLRAGGNGSFELVNVATGDTIQPNGTRSQFTGAVTLTNAAGSWFAWNTRGSAPAAS